MQNIRTRELLKYIGFILVVITTAVAITASLIVEDVTTKNTLLLVTSILSIVITISMFFYFNKTKNDIKDTSLRSTNILFDKTMTLGKMGMITFSNKDKIITYVTDYLYKHNFDVLIGKPITELSVDLKDLYSIEELTIKKDGRFYEIKVYTSLNTILVKDVTAFNEVHNLFNDRLSAIVLIKVDHYNSLTQLVENSALKVNNVVSNYLTKWSDEYNAYLKINPTDGGTTLILLNKEKLTKSLIVDKNNILDQIKKNLEKEKLKAIISIGISYGNASNKELGTLAQEALEISENRGGDQVIIKEFGLPTIFGSGLTEKDQSSSKIVAKTFSDFMVEQIKKANKVIIAGHFLADADAIASALGVGFIADKIYGKKTYILIDTIEDTAAELLKNTLTKKEYAEKIIDPKKAIRLYDDKTLLVVVDTSSLRQTPMRFVLESSPKKKKIFVIDHHRVSQEKIPTLNNSYEYIDVSASSASEIVVDILGILLSSKLLSIGPKLANLMLTGIYLDTKELTKKTTPKTLDAASWLTSKGAVVSEAHENLKINLFDSKMINNIQKSVQIYKKSFAIAYTEIENKNIGTTISIAAEKMIDIKNIRASFVIAKLGHNKFRVSCRSGENFNVQSVAEMMGGGGHFNAAAFVAQDLAKEDLYDQLKYSIDETLKHYK